MREKRFVTKQTISIMGLGAEPQPTMLTFSDFGDEFDFIDTPDRSHSPKYNTEQV